LAALNLQSGEIVGSLHRHHRTQEFQQLLDRLDAAVPADLGGHLGLDHYATHQAPPILWSPRLFGRVRRPLSRIRGPPRGLRAFDKRRHRVAGRRRGVVRYAHPDPEGA